MAQIPKLWSGALLLSCILGPVMLQLHLGFYQHHGGTRSNLASQLEEIFSSTANEKKIDEGYQLEVSRLDELIQKIAPLNRARHIQTLNKAQCGHEPGRNRTNTSSSLEFLACCGLGHRLARMANVAHLSAALRAPLYGFWGCCNGVRVFDHLFGADAMIISANQQVFSRRIEHAAHFQFRFDVTGPIFGMVGRKKNAVSCSVRTRKMQTDYQFYSQIRERYRQKDKVDAFVEQHFKGNFAIGIHIRAGNNEKGDFVRKRRQITISTTEFVRRLIPHLDTIVNQYARPTGKNPVIFVASDTLDYIHELRSSLGNRSVIGIAYASVRNVT